MAQLVAHLHGMEGVGSSNLPSSTVKAFKDFLGSLFVSKFLLISIPVVPQPARQRDASALGWKKMNIHPKGVAI